MSYLAQPTSNLDYGVVKIGANINVLDGIISLAQDLSPNANVTFFNANVTNQFTANNANVANLYADGNLVVTSVTPTAGSGISIANLISNGYHSSFTVLNTGVLSLIAGTGISLTANTGNITISSFGADLINVIGVTTNYTATLTDEYIGVSSATAVTITLPSGINGRVYTIKDEFGQGSGKITIQPQSGEKIDNANSYTISVPYQSVSVVFRAGKWWII